MADASLADRVRAKAAALALRKDEGQGASTLQTASGKNRDRYNAEFVDGTTTDAYDVWLKKQSVK